MKDSIVLYILLELFWEMSGLANTSFCKNQLCQFTKSFVRTTPSKHTTSFQRCNNVLLTSEQRCYNVKTTSCACWTISDLFCVLFYWAYLGFQHCPRIVFNLSRLCGRTTQQGMFWLCLCWYLINGCYSSLSIPFSSQFLVVYVTRLLSKN